MTKGPTKTNTQNKQSKKATRLLKAMCGPVLLITPAPSKEPRPPRKGWAQGAQSDNRQETS